MNAHAPVERPARLIASVDRPDIFAAFAPTLRQFGCDDAIMQWAEGYARMHAGRIAADVEFLTSRHTLNSCLNVGGAPFLFEYLLRAKLPDLRLVSLDLDPARFPEAAAMLEMDILAIDIEAADADLSTIEGSFDCVVLCEIFEHFRLDLLGTVGRVRSLLSQGGLLYLTTPNGVSAAGLKRVLAGNTGPDPLGEWTKLTRLGHMGHVREYSAREVVSVLAACGFRILSCDFRQRRDRSWTERLASIRPSLGSEIVIVAERA